MTSIYNNDLFEKYYQKEYDFNTLSLEKAEINAIKKLMLKLLSSPCKYKYTIT